MSLTVKGLRHIIAKYPDDTPVRVLTEEDGILEAYCQIASDDVTSGPYIVLEPVYRPAPPTPEWMFAKPERVFMPPPVIGLEIPEEDDPTTVTPLPFPKP